MSTLLQEDALTDWLVAYLTADTALMALCNGDVAPEVNWDENASPFVRVDRLEASDLMVIGLFRVWTDCLYHVRGCLQWRGTGQPDRTDVNAIGFRIDALLHDQETTSLGFSIHSFREEGEPNPAQVEADGRLWLQSGGLYRIRAA